MSEYRHCLPQLNGKFCITDGGMETDFCFNHKIELPEFAAYDLLRDEAGYSRLFDYYKSFAELAQRFAVGLVLETPTWRANPDWGTKLGDSKEALHKLNLASVKLVEHVREDFNSEEAPIIISGCVGPRGDGYRPDGLMSAHEAQHYHTQQLATFAESNVDMVAALTINYAAEAEGITKAAQQLNLPVCISFTVETDGNLPTGQTLGEAIMAVDQATDNGPAYYMINCAHPSHFGHLFTGDEPWLDRIKGLRANASCLSHEELDGSETLDDGEPITFGRELGELKAHNKQLTVLGGCCGTDYRHIEQVCHNIH